LRPREQRRLAALVERYQRVPEIAFGLGQPLFPLTMAYLLVRLARVSARNGNVRREPPASRRLSRTALRAGRTAQRGRAGARCQHDAVGSGLVFVAMTARTCAARVSAHCASLSVNAVHEQWNRNPRRLAHADTLARAVNLDMAAGWSPTVDNYLGRVPKARILEAVREAKGEAAAQLIDHLKKPEMAKEAERLLAGTRWLPEPLRTPCAQVTAIEPEGDADAAGLPAFLADGEDDGAPRRPGSPIASRHKRSRPAEAHALGRDLQAGAGRHPVEAAEAQRVQYGC
jgi:hypothetical protein